MEVSIRKHFINTSSNVCILPKDIFDALNLSKDISYTIHFGISQQISFINFLESEEKNIYFPENMFDQLHLLDPKKLNIWKSDNDIFLGPVVGVFVTPYFMKGALEKKYNYFVKPHIRAALAEKCLGYFFSIDDIDWVEKKVKGYTFIPGLNKYDSYWFPLPNVIYDKAGGTTGNQKQCIMEAREKFKNNPNIKLINTLNKLGKWELYEALSKYPELKKYVPDTIIYSDFNDLLYMLNKNDIIFLKSFYGSAGAEVLLIEKFSGKYKLNYYQMSLKEIFLDTIDEVKEFVTKFINNKEFIIQQGMRLLSFKNRRMDIRMFMMKNETGKWESIFKCARIAKENFPITNLHAGANRAIYEQIYPKLKEQYPLLELPDAKELNEIAIILAIYIEKELGSLGEIGLDIGIDTTGRIFIIEANAKPDKELESDILDINGTPWIELVPKFYNGTMKSNKALPQALGIFKYAKFLTGVNKI